MNTATTCHEDVVVLPQTDESTLCVTLRGVVSLKSYEECFYKPLKAIMEKGDQFNLLINYDQSYEGWSREAAELSFQSIIDFGGWARKLAYVNPPDSKRFQVNVTRPLLGGEVRFFENSELDEAIKWVKA